MDWPEDLQQEDQASIIESPLVVSQRGHRLVLVLKNEHKGDKEVRKEHQVVPDVGLMEIGRRILWFLGMTRA